MNPGPGHREHGFTLLELALTLVVVSILLTLAVPRLPSLGRTDLEASADRLASTMTYLSDEASLRGRIYRLTLDLETESWDVAGLSPFAPRGASADSPGFLVDGEDPMARSIQLPDGVFLDAVVDRDGETTAGTRAIYFLPEGSSETVAVRLHEQDGAATTVTLRAATGSAVRGETTYDETRDRR
ncbi:MAG: Tfp pilus assembly protein FimT/FimU [Candidatus Binatia bacterium]